MNTQCSTTPLPSLRRFVGFFLLILPICLALGQSTPVASPVVYTGTDFSANVTAGPVVDVKQLASKSPGPAGSAGGETHFNRFPKLLPPMRDTGETAPQLPATALARLPEMPDSSFRGFIGLTHLDQRLYAGGGNQFSTEPPDQGLAVGNGFVLEGVNAADGNGPRIPDFPHFAVDRYGLFVNWQEFRINPDGSFDGYIGTAILAVSKTALSNGGGGRPPRRLELFRIPFSDTGFAFRVWPAYIPPGQTPVLSNGGTEYFASSNVSGNSGHHIAVWALTNTSSLDTPSPNLQLSTTAVSTQQYVFPNFGVPLMNCFHPLGALTG